jgi:isocitrate dehydrogenase (NAD+)
MEVQKITLLKGDGIGPEICDSVLRVFEAAKVPVQWEEVEAGLSAFEKTGDSLPQEVLETLEKNKIALKGPTTTPIGKGHQSINVRIRKSLDLFVNVRPSLSLPALPTPFNDVDLVIVRENIEDTYGGIEYRQSYDSAVAIRVSTRTGAKRAHEYAFELAKKEGRKTVTCIHKANIMKLTDGQWLEAFYEVANDYPDIQAKDMLIDNCCMQLVQRPQQFDVLVLPNLFGDIVSDLCAGLVGGLGIASGANIGCDVAVFEAVHGSAPDIAGKGLANPTAILFSAISMLYHMGLKSHASQIKEALRKALLVESDRTADLGGRGNTEIFTQRIISLLERQS